MIMACFLLHNFIRGEMINDLIEQQQLDGATNDVVNEEADGDLEFVDQVQTSTVWTQMQDDLANSMWTNVCSFI